MHYDFDHTHTLRTVHALKRKFGVKLYWTTDFTSPPLTFRLWPDFIYKKKTINGSIATSTGLTMIQLISGYISLNKKSTCQCQVLSGWW